jgi:uncharacterized membrane protein YbhN (UPF0104 family)
MLTENQKRRKWITLSSMLGFLAFILYLLFFTNFAEVGKVIGGTNIVIYILAFAFVVVSSRFDTLAWKSTLDGLSVKTTSKRIFNLSWVSTSTARTVLYLKFYCSNRAVNRSYPRSVGLNCF